MKKISFLSVLLCTSFLSLAQEKILVFSKTAGFRHASIAKGQEFFKKLAEKEKYTITFSEDSEVFNEENLKTFNAVVFLNTTGDILNEAQQVAFERYIQAGGGFMGIHAATDTEYSWPWYNGLVGAYFASHPGKNVSNVQEGEMTVLDKSHPSTRHMPEKFKRMDEFYDFKSLKKEQLNFLIRVDEKSYQEGKMGDFHPMSWYQNYDGGKVFYTNFGHTDETFTEELSSKHIEEGLKTVLASKLDYSKAYSEPAPEENRFVREVLIDNLDEPTELATLPNGKVIFVERKGAVKVWDPSTKTVEIAAQMPVYTKFEYGLMGVGIDPNFEKNKWIYLFYTPETNEHMDNFLSRFTFNDIKNEVDLSTEKVILRFPVKRIECCHTGGSIEWDAMGNLYLSTGDDTNPFASDGYAPIDFQEGRSGWDALRSSGNTNDLRGKILRIKPTEEGSYSIPEGNLFPVGTPNTRPEIFVMGCRNPYRISVDQRTNYLYWGDVGPDAGKANPERGPEGQVEFNQARKAGNFGWPLFVGNNDAYRAFDFEKKISGPAFNPEKPENNSPNNTGLKILPPTQKPLIWYGYGESEKFPLLGKGGANPMAGPVYYFDDYKENDQKLPKYYDGKLLIYEWMRDWILAVTLNEKGDYVKMEPFMPNTKFYHPMDMALSQNGELYVLDYGMNWFSKNKDASLSRITYNRGNRTPVVKVSADKVVGAAPLTVAFNSEGTLDYDNDKLSFLWNFGSKTSKLPNPTFTFKKPGIYPVTLEVRDSFGNKKTETVEIQVGNQMPEIEITVDGNQSFFFEGQPINYSVNVKDKEDGSLGNGISEEDIIVQISYLEGYDETIMAQGHQRNLSFSSGKRLVETGDCMACHAANKKSIGPSYSEIANKYKRNRENVNYLAGKIIKGGGGVWGDQAMAAHPDLSEEDAKTMVNYILSINDDRVKSLSAAGSYETSEHKGKKDGAYVILATYTDKGGDVIGPLTVTKSLAIRNTMVKSTAYSTEKNTMKFDVPGIGEVVIVNDGSELTFNKMDLRGFKGVQLGAMGRKGQTAGGTVELYLGRDKGTKLLEATIKEDNVVPLQVELDQTVSEVDDLVLVFKNASAEGKPLFAFGFIKFTQ